MAHPSEPGDALQTCVEVTPRKPERGAPLAATHPANLPVPEHWENKQRSRGDLYPAPSVKDL